MSRTWPASLVLAGAGKMGGALLRGWLTNGLPPQAVRIVDPQIDPAVQRFCDEQGVACGTGGMAPEVLVLAVKPQTFAADPGAFAPMAGAGTLVVSILAGKTIAGLRGGLPQSGAIVRAMPNLPAAIGRGATALASEGDVVAPRQRRFAETIFEAVGIAEWVDEALIDAVTAVSGSGPAYVFLLAECLARAGVSAGLPDEIASRLARATVEGAAALMAASPDRTPATLREAVTSPGGTTAAALAILHDSDALAALLDEAVAAARRRAGELAG